MNHSHNITTNKSFVDFDYYTADNFHLTVDNKKILVGSIYQYKNDEQEFKVTHKLDSIPKKFKS